MPHDSLKRPLIVFLAGLAILLGGAAVWLYGNPPAREAVQSGPGAAEGKALVGGPFTLVDQHGETRRESDFAGRYMLIYFGFTYCPDVCPTSLSVMTRALDRLAESAPDRAERIVPILISVDPERDTPEVLARYGEHFHPRLVALTGSADAVAEAAEAYRVYYRKADDPDSGTYLIDHTSIIYLMGPDGEYVTHFTHGTTAEELLAGLQRHLGG